MNVAAYLVLGVRIEYDVGAVRNPALLPLSTTSRIVICTPPTVDGSYATEEADNGSTAGALPWRTQRLTRRAIRLLEGQGYRVTLEPAA